MKVLYTCAQCGALDREVEVPTREPGADIHTWMTSVQMALGADHSQRGCASRTCDLKIPMPKDADYIGQDIKQ